YLGRLIKAFAADNNPHNEKFYRWFNEIPVLLLIVIVILVVVKPF
ncbi:MAG: CopD family protein, partial [Proteobacteria bacterium]|nr:CopD family protein [Pseudomonadota bacterium]